MKFASFAQIRESLGESRPRGWKMPSPGREDMNCGPLNGKKSIKGRPYANLYPSFKNGGGLFLRVQPEGKAERASDKMKYSYEAFISLDEIML
ncbi:hypothetical protein TNCV_534541 [Trichonephila clavipes]|uniref:Uncharacterized protein n=1 Tax=Trichonephila clavata TaxID=2740835 RepID=A0A8X6INP4_TRICU|nr:hypothetical protein TNCT_722911 [Trichonephila clavata]GFU80580.1 hypothetical protein TNCV_534541 [Trichonephila clavipes]